ARANGQGRRAPNVSTNCTRNCQAVVGSDIVQSPATGRVVRLDQRVSIGSPRGSPGGYSTRTLKVFLLEKDPAPVHRYKSLVWQAPGLTYAVPANCTPASRAYGRAARHSPDLAFVWRGC